jgi:hypothetical protein
VIVLSSAFPLSLNFSNRLTSAKTLSLCRSKLSPVYLKREVERGEERERERKRKRKEEGK